MKKIKILKMPNRMLRTVCEPIEKITKKHIELSKLMKAALTIYGGVGLAAPQTGRAIRMIVINTKKTDPDNGIVKTLINPEMLFQTIESTVFNEGCLSLPGETGIVKRSKEVVVKFKDEYGFEKIETFKDLNAVVVQHEMDHLDGVLFTDYR